MKKKMLILSIAIAMIAVVVLAAARGIVHQVFTRYVPASGVNSDGQPKFRIGIYPEFTMGGTRGYKAVIPLLYGVQRESSAEPHLFLGLSAPGPFHGYQGKRSLTLTSVTVTNEKGTVTRLVVPRSPRTFNIEHGRGSFREDIGKIDGEKLTIAVDGTALTITGEILTFSETIHWVIDRTTRTEPGILYAE